MAEEPSSGISTTARTQRERHQTGNGAAEHRPNQKEQLEGGQHEQRGVDTGRSNQYLHMQCLHIKVSPAHANISLNIPAAPLEGLFQGLGFTLNEPGGLPRCLQNPASQFPSSSHPAPRGGFKDLPRRRVSARLPCSSQAPSRGSAGVPRLLHPSTEAFSLMAPSVP